MWRRLLTCASALLLIVLCVLLLNTSHAQVFAYGYTSLDTPTPDAATTLQQANDAVSHAQDLLNIVNGFVGLLALVLAALGVGAGLLTYFGLKSYREMSNLNKELRNGLEETQKEAKKTREALVYLSLGDRSLAQKGVREALENYHIVGKLLPHDTHIQYVLGKTYAGLGEYEMAITALEASHPVEPAEQAKVAKELGLAYRRRGDALKQEADFEKAIQYLRKSLSLDPDDDDTFSILGGLYRRKKEYKQALDTYEQAWQLNPGSSYALGNLASLSWYFGKVNEARMYFGYTEVAAGRRIKRGGLESFWDYYDLALAQLVQGKINAAQHTYQKALQDTPGNVQINAVLDNLYLLQQAPETIPGLDDVVKMLEHARTN